MSLPTEAVTLSGSGLVFLNSYGDGVSAAFRSAIIVAENELQSRFTNVVTLSMNFDLQALDPKFAAQNSYSTIAVSYASLTAALRARAATADDQLAAGGLPTLDPSGGVGFSIPTAQAVILGLAPQTNKGDANVILNSALNWTYGQDAVGALEHEITEGGFGRVASLGVQSATWATLDLFRFTAAGQRDYTGGGDRAQTFFGLDSAHVTSLGYHNAISPTGVDDGFDLGDWESTRGDAFGPGGPNSPGHLSATDLRVLDILGWTPMALGAYTPAADDYASSLTDRTAPFGLLSASGVGTGALQFAGDRDWFRIQAYAGFTYTVTLTGLSGGGGTLADPYLRLRDGSGGLLSQNDDIVLGTNPDSRLSFAPTASGTDYLEVGAFADAYAGSYTIALVASVALPLVISAALANILRAAPTDPSAAALASQLSVGTTAGALSQAQALTQIIVSAGATSSVATLSYEFFTGRAPSAAGMDYLVSPTGPNPNNLNSAYYQSFGLENRYINFAVNLGKGGEGNAAFTAAFGAENLFAATRDAYTKIFGGTPSDTKLHALLDPSFVVGGASLTRADYFAVYGGDGPDGIGAKAAMVGWLLAEAVKADLGTYAHANDAFLTDVGLNNAPFGVDLVGLYAKPGDVFVPG